MNQKWSRWRYTGSLLVLLAIGSVCLVARAGEITLVPWPYGLIAYVDLGAPGAVDVDIVTLTRATEEVCAFWNAPPPAPAEDWEQPFSRTRASCGGYSNGERLPDNTNGVARWYPCSWVSDELTFRECIVVVYSDRERLGAAIGAFDVRASFLPSGFFSEDDNMLLPGPVILFSLESLRSEYETVCHEMTHWIFQLSAAFPGSQLLALREGAAELTGRTLSEAPDAWETAALYSAEGSLSEIPLSLVYPIGATVVELLRESSAESWGDVSPKCGASSRCPDWADIAGSVESAWLERAAEVRTISRGARVRYDAVKQRLFLVEALLEPVLSEEAGEILAAIRDDRGTEESIERFWTAVERTPEYSLGGPPDSTWDALERREMTFVRLLIANARYAAPPAPEHVPYQGMDVPDRDLALERIARLVGLRELGLWKAYYAEYLSLVRQVGADGFVDSALIPWGIHGDET